MTQTSVLTPDQVKRYSRHIIMPQVGSAGQRKMLDAKVLVIGAGGLGSPVSIYLALAGVGTQAWSWATSAFSEPMKSSSLSSGGGGPCRVSGRGL